jgi:hypothetical protein
MARAITAPKIEASRINLEAVMSKERIDAMQARLDVMALAMVALAPVVPMEQAASLQDGLRRNVAQRLDGVTLSPQADAAVAADLGSLMSALRVKAA